MKVLLDIAKKYIDLLKKIVNRVLKGKSMVNEKNIITQERITISVTKQKHANEIELFAGMLNLFTNGFSTIGQFVLNTDNEVELVWLYLSTRCLHSIRCAVDLSIKGYYSQAMSIIRTITEDWFICGNAKNNMNVRKYLLEGEGDRLIYIDLAKQMNASHIYEGDYRYQSKFAHSSKLSLRVLLDSETNSIRTGAVYDEMLFLLCAESLMRVFLLMSEYLAHLLYSIDKKKASAWTTDNIEKSKDVVKWLEALRVKYGGEVEDNGIESEANIE